MSGASGVVVRSHGLFHDVDVDGALVRCTARGKLKRSRAETGGVIVGDRVDIDIEIADRAVGVITAVGPRDQTLTRRAVMRGQPDQIILANATHALIVFSLVDPEPRRRMLDRFLVLADAQEMEPIICLNKRDLDPTGERAARFDVYRRIGYRVLTFSARTGEGVDALADAIAGRIAVMAGPSGVGKTTMLNRLAGTNLTTSEISAATGKGVHTTRGAHLVRLGTGYLADTAGIRALALAQVDREDLDHHFVEIRPFRGHCRFPNCHHVTEPDCAVIAAHARGEIDAERLASYHALYERFDED